VQVDQPVRKHIERIREFIEVVSQEIALEKDPARVEQLTLDLRSLHLALSHYELALKIEDTVIASRSIRA
jgi:hypothetical protein